MASVLKLLQNVDPRIRQYIRYYKISEVYECLLSGLCVMRPDDCIPWLIEKLEILHNVTAKEIRWNMFIPDELRPLQKPVDETTLSYIFNFLDEMLDPPPDMIEKAFSVYNKNLQRKLFYIWLKTHMLKKYQANRYAQQYQNAVQFHKFKLQKFFFNEWINWKNFRKDRQAIAHSKISRVFKILQMHTIVGQWHIATKDARRTREYFERLERGENINDNNLDGVTGEARDDISALPRSAAVKIFSYLSIVDLHRCAQVCRSWKMLTNSNILWSKLDLYPVRDILTDEVFGKLIKKSRPYLIHLNLREAPVLTKNALVLIGGCRNLQDLNLSGCKALNDELVNIVTTGCHILLYLNVSYNSNVTDATIRSLSKNCINLQYLSLAFCTKLTDKAFAHLSNTPGLRKLVYIDVSGCEQITPYGYEAIANHCRNLETTVLNDFTNLDDHHVRMLSQTCTRLTSITIMDSPFITDEAFKSLSQAKHLKRIKIAGNRSITDSTFKALTRHCPDLQHVYVTDCPKITDSSLKYLSACKNLIVLNIADCIRVSDIGIKLLSEGSCASKLREVNLTNCIRIGNPSLVALSKKCKNITYLALCFCEQIQEDGLSFLSSMENLVSIDLSGCRCGDYSLKGIGTGGRLRFATFSNCKDITDLGLQKFCNQCPNLETLDLSYCPQLTDNSIKSLAFSCKLIRHLNLCSCSLLTDMSLQYLSGVCTYLQSLDVSYCQSISDKGMKHLVKGCKYMERLLIVNCRFITREMIEKLQERVPEVEYQVILA